MPFVSGTRFGSFEILDRLGAGGMGEVYRARDLRLDRTVAIKVIRASDGHRHDRLERFKREARAISRLNHPHICALYDIGEQDGEAFLVMEYVAGETLTDRLSRGSLRLEDALRYGVQIADALDTAHRNGVVHRDLKPSNVIIGRDGVKLLDFGLAKLREVESGVVDQTTTALGLSEEGLVIGSLPYMAPEQVEGRRADARSDVFALGVVLYEMVTGNPPFQGDSKASLIVAILSQQPRPVSVRQPLMPPLFERAIDRCLAKSADDRWQTAADLKAELQYVLETLHDAPNTARKVGSTRRPGLRLAAGIAVFIAAAAGAGMAYLKWPVRTVASYTNVTFRFGAISTARFTPDGQNIVYSASWDGQPYEVFLGHEGSADARGLGLENGRILSVSAIGDLALVFGRQNTTHLFGTLVLARVPLAGGTRRDLLEGVTEADWIPGTDDLAIVRRRAADAMAVVEFPIGTKVHEAKAVWSLRVSPDGRRVAFFEGPVRFGTLPEASITVVDRSGAASILSAKWAGIGLAWNPSGSEVWFTATRADHPGPGPALEAVSLSGKHRPVQTAPDWLVLQDISRDGRVLLTRNSVRQSASCSTRGADAERDLTWIGGTAVSDLSPDGQTLIFNETLAGAPSGIPSIFKRNLDGSPAVRLGLGNGPSLSPDTKWVLALLREEWVVLPTGAGTTRTLPSGTVAGRDSGAWLPDGQHIVFTGTEGGPDRRRIYIQDIEQGNPRALTPEGVVLAARAASPDGVHLLGRAAGGWFLYPIAGGTPQPVPGVKADDEPLRWTADGHSLYAVSRGVPMVPRREIARVDVMTGARTVWKTLAPSENVGVDNVGAIVMTPDESAYCYTYLRRLGALFVVDGLK